jgi:cysteine desulfurase
MRPWFVERWANPSSAHPDGHAAREAIAEARAEVARSIGAEPDEIVFTGSGTESSNLAIRGAFAAVRQQVPDRSRVVCTSIEHPATHQPMALLAAGGAEHTVLPVDSSGRAVIPTSLPSDTAVVSVMHANNETGVIQPVAELAAVAHAAGALVHVDAAQSLGKIPVDVDALSADLMTIAGHKLYGPKGVGALYIRRGTPLHPVLVGAGHERGLRPGTENVPGIVGLGAACTRVRLDLEWLSERFARQTAQLWSNLQQGIPHIARSGAGPFLPNTLNVRFPGALGSAVLAQCPTIAASTGSACHADVEHASPVLLAMGLAPEDALGAVRLSIGRHTTDEDIERAGDALIRAYRALL